MKFNHRNSNFVYMYSRLRRLYRKYSSKVLNKFDLTQSEIDVLTFLNNNRPNFNTASDITKYNGVSKALVSKSVNSLIDKGLLESKINEDDARVMNLYIRDEADFAVSELQAANVKFYEQLLANIDEEELSSFYRVTNKILNNLDDIKKGEDL